VIGEGARPDPDDDWIPNRCCFYLLSKAPTRATASRIASGMT
jgi:hypothetical protein